MDEFLQRKCDLYLIVDYMGLNFADQYSILHFSVGSVAYFWNIPLLIALIGHTIFELGENTKTGITFINKHFIRSGVFRWPGGKNYADSYLNIFGDTVFFVIGWCVSAFLDVIGTQRQWYIANPKT